METTINIEVFGMGVYVPAGDATKNACLDALKMGYRHIDTAHAYQNDVICCGV